MCFCEILITGPTTTLATSTPATSTSSAACAPVEYTVAEDTENLIAEYCMPTVRLSCFFSSVQKSGMVGKQKNDVAG